MPEKKYMTIVVEVPNDDFYKKVQLGSLFYGAQVVAMAYGDKIERNERLKESKLKGE